MLAARPGLDQAHLGTIWIERCTGRAIAGLSDGEVSVLVEFDGNRLPKSRQHLGLEIQPNDVGRACTYFNDSRARCTGRGDVGDAGAGVGQQAADKFGFGGADRRHNMLCQRLGMFMQGIG